MAPPYKTVSIRQCQVWAAQWWNFSAPVSSQWWAACCSHYNDFIMGTIASQITSLTIVYSTVYSEADQRKHQSSASLAFVRGIQRGPVASNAENVSIWWRHHGSGSANPFYRWTVGKWLTRLPPLWVAKRCLWDLGAVVSKPRTTTWSNSLIISICPAANAYRHVLMSPPYKNDNYKQIFIITHAQWAELFPCSDSTLSQHDD